jgi:adhesin transport system outer membrane protein
VIGHTQNMKDKTESYNKALGYSKNIENLLIKNGLEKTKIVSQSRVDFDNLFLETDLHKLNNVVAITLYVPSLNEKNILDDDKDGVINELDKCPNTTKGYTVDKDGCTQKINLEVLFENNSSTIKEDTKDKVLAFSKFLQDNKEFDTMITGHASNDGKSSAFYNKKLSLQRADTIKEILVEDGVESSRITTTGKGYEQPVAKNDTAEGRALNRRIEAELININNK